MKLNTLERQVLDAYRDNLGAENVSGSTEDINAWIQLGLTVLLEAGRRVRALRLSPLEDTVHFKPDGSPATYEEQEIEQFFRKKLAKFAPDASVIGEETGGEWCKQGIIGAIDPIDGTWSFINRSDTHTTSLAFFRNEQLFLTMISNPSAGEIAYASPDSQARLIQLSVFGEGDQGYSLPLQVDSQPAMLVNVHPSKKAGLLFSELNKFWQEGKIQMLKAVGGSPSGALLEVAKGKFTYFNMWSQGTPDPFDLAPGVALVRAAGGEVLSFDGVPVDPMQHSGPFVAGINVDRLLQFVRLLSIPGMNTI